ncbi:MAG: 1-phosphofructokinase family hexose kinase [bacterium]
MKRIVTLTLNPSVDTSAYVEHVVVDDKLRCQQPNYEPGGGGINVSRAVRRLGGESIALYTSGGLYGQMLQRLLNEEGVQHDPIPIKRLTRENIIIVENSTGRQFRFNMPGPTLDQKEWEACLHRLSSIIPKPDYIVASGSLPPGVPEDFYARTAHIARGLGARIIVDTSGEALHLAARSGVYLFKPNMKELQALVKHEVRNESELEAAALKFIREEQSHVVVISLGAAGALMVTKQGCERLRAPTVPIRSKVGAGDSMVAGIVLSLARGRPIKEAIQFGIAAGSAAVMNPDTKLCSKEDTEQLLEQLIAEHKG